MTYNIQRYRRGFSVLTVNGITIQISGTIWRNTEHLYSSIKEITQLEDCECMILLSYLEGLGVVEGYAAKEVYDERG